MKLFTIGFYYLNDKNEKCYYYNIYAYSEKQAKFFLAKTLGISFTLSLKQAYVMKHKTNNNVVVLVSSNFEEINESSLLIGNIYSLN